MPPAVFSTLRCPLPVSASGFRDAQAGAYAATGYCIATGKPSIFVSEGTVEALAAASAALTAWADKQPVTFLCRVPEEDFNLVKGAFSPVARTVLEARGGKRSSVPSLPSPTYRAYPAAVLVSPRADLRRTIGSLAAGSAGYPSIPAERVDLRDVANTFNRAVRLLERSKRPALLLGRGGTWDVPEVVRLAEMAGCPILLTAGATTMPADKLSLLGCAGVPVVPSGNLAWVRIFAASDLILALGAGLSEADWFGLEETKIHRAKVVRVDLAPDPEGDAPCHHSISMPVKAFAQEMLERGIPDLSRMRRAWLARTVRWCRRWEEALEHEAAQGRTGHPLDPACVAREIVRHSPPEAIFVSEGGACGMWLLANLWLRPLVFPVQQATIGTSIPMALGAAHGTGGAPVWCVLGDGAFFYHAAELATLARRRVPAVLFVFNDSSWGAIRLGQTFACRGRYTGTDIPSTSYAAFAQAFGCDALTVARPDELDDALNRAAAARRPLLVDVKIRKDAVPFAGANFVLAEFDGVLKTSAPALAAGTLFGALRRKVPAGVLRVVTRMMLR